MTRQDPKRAGVAGCIEGNFPRAGKLTDSAYRQFTDLAPVQAGFGPKFKRFILLALALVLVWSQCLPLLPGPQELAAQGLPKLARIPLAFGPDSKLTSQDLAQRSYQLWRISDLPSAQDQKDFYKWANQATGDELTDRYGQAQLAETEPVAKRIWLKDIGPGRYYIRESSYIPGSFDQANNKFILDQDLAKLAAGKSEITLMAPVVLDITDDLLANWEAQANPELAFAQLKEETIKIPTATSLRLYKYDGSSKKALAGVAFSLFQVTADNPSQQVYVKDGRYIPGRDGETVLYTDQKGYINVGGLPEGDYYWQEMMPLAGYEGRTSKFTVRSKQGKTVLIKVENKKIQESKPQGTQPKNVPKSTKPHGGQTKNVPNTGENRLALLGAILLALTALLLLIWRLFVGRKDKRGQGRKHHD